MMLAAALFLVAAAILCALALETKQRRQLARGLVRFAGTINKPRHAEFVGDRIGMLVVTHRIDEVFSIADRVAVLHDGTLVHDEAVLNSSPDEVFAHITGTQIEELSTIPAKPTLFEAKHRKNRHL